MRRIPMLALALVSLVACDQERDRPRYEQSAAPDELARIQIAQEEARARAAAARARRREVEASALPPQTAAATCDGVVNPDGCPVDGTYVETTINEPEGIGLRMRREAGTRPEIEQRIECYRVRTFLRSPSEEAHACVFELGAAEMRYHVRDDEGYVAVHVETSRGEVDRLRDDVRERIAQTYGPHQDPLAD